MDWPRMLRRRWLDLAATTFVALGVGCQSPFFFRGQSPEADQGEGELIEEGVKLVGKMALPKGFSYIKVEGVGLVVQLDHTGSSPAPGPHVDALKDEMETHDVAKPNELLDSDTTSLVLLRALIPPAAQPGDRIDVEVRLPSGSKTTSLREGWLMQARLREYAMLGNRIHTGRELAVGLGNVVVDGVFQVSREELADRHGMVLGGGTVTAPRLMGLQMREKYASPFNTSAIANALNARFHHYDHGIKKGVATAKDDMQIHLAVPARYKNHLTRYYDVVRSVAVGESVPERGDRLRKLERLLHEPTSAARAALELEAIGEDAIPVLKTGLLSPNPEVHFYAAEALAYLDVDEAAAALGIAASNERAFRWHALTALSVMDHVAAYDQLVRLLDDSSAETRYGAFRALRTRNARDPMLQGEVLSNQFVLHQVECGGEPLIHFSSTRKPEVVVFGRAKLEPPPFLMVGRQVMVKGQPDGRIQVTRYRPGKDDDVQVVSDDLSQVIRALGAVGVSYADLYESMATAKSRGYLNCRLAVNAQARRNRVYHRDEEDSSTAAEPLVRPAAPLPEMFDDRPIEEQAESVETPDILPEEVQEKRGFFGKIGSRRRVADEK